GLSVAARLCDELGWLSLDVPRNHRFGTRFRLEVMGAVAPFPMGVSAGQRRSPARNAECLPNPPTRLVLCHFSEHQTGSVGVFSRSGEAGGIISARTRPPPQNRYRTGSRCDLTRAGVIRSARSCDV